ncbi:MAG: enoyl-CoA hydratase/isomerase family protein, partial [bacterium]
MTEQKNVIEFTVRDQTAIVRLNRPEVHNSVDKAVMDQLESILDRIEEDSGIRTLILTGTGNQSFCA